MPQKYQTNMCKFIAKIANDQEDTSGRAINRIYGCVCNNLPPSLNSLYSLKKVVIVPNKDIAYVYNVPQTLRDEVALRSDSFFTIARSNMSRSRPSIRKGR